MNRSQTTSRSTTRPLPVKDSGSGVAERVPSDLMFVNTKSTTGGVFRKNANLGHVRPNSYQIVYSGSDEYQQEHKTTESDVDHRFAIDVRKFHNRGGGTHFKWLNANASTEFSEEFTARKAEFLSHIAEEPVRLLLEAFGILFNCKKFYENAVQNLTKLSGQGLLKSHLKFALAQPMAELTRDIYYEPVKPPSGVIVEDEKGRTLLYILDLFALKGSERHRVLTRLTERGSDGVAPLRRTTVRCFSVLSLKNLAPKLSLEEEATAVVDHMELLTSPVNPKLTSRQRLCFEEIVEHIIPGVHSFDDLPRGKLTDRANLLETTDPFGNMSRRKLRSGLGFKQEVSTIGDAEARSRAFCSDFGPSCGSNVKTFLQPDGLFRMSHNPKMGLAQVRNRPLREEEEDELLDVYIDNAMTDQNEADVVALLEPLKVRTISIDSGILRYLASRIQKFLWKRMSDSPVFGLTKGQTVEEAVDGLFIRNLPFISGDYKGATDSIHSNATDYVIRLIFKHIAVPPHLARHMEAIRRDLTSVILNYAKVLDSDGIPYLLELEKRLFPYDQYVSFTYSSDRKNGKSPTFHDVYTHFVAHHHVDPWVDMLKEDKFKQTRGQLMGNVLSFSVLCIINLCAFCHSSLNYLERESRAGRDMGGSDPQDRATWDLLTSFCEEIPDDDEPQWRVNTGKFQLKFRSAKAYGTIDYVKDSAAEHLLFRNVPVRINGDDILFQANKRFYDCWSKTIKLYGLEKSVGKNYFHPNFFTINSQLFTIDSPRFFSLELTGMQVLNSDEFAPARVNVVWFSGLSPTFLRKRSDFKALTGKASSAYQDTRQFLPQVQKAFLSSIDNKSKIDQFNTLWLKSNNDYVTAFDSDKFSVSRSLPTQLGGLGLTLPYEENLTYSQKVLAGRLALDPSFSRKLGETPYIKILMKRLRRYVETKYTIVELPIDEIAEVGDHSFWSPSGADAPLGYRVLPFTDMILKLAPMVFPLWREPPPDNVDFKRQELTYVTDKAFSWALKCRKGLRDKLVNEQTLPRATSLFIKIVDLDADPLDLASIVNHHIRKTDTHDSDEALSVIPGLDVCMLSTHSLPEEEIDVEQLTIQATYDSYLEAALGNQAPPGWELDLLFDEQREEDRELTERD